MSRLSASFVLGYHGCDQAVAEQLIDGRPFKSSDNDYDWLGPGTYFWEANPQRGLNFVRESMAREGSRIKRPAVVGAIIVLGDCLDLMTQVGIDMVRAAYRSLSVMLAGAGEVMPRNQDRLRRQLDCAVIRHLHAIYDHQGDRLDSVRGVFVEGREVYPGSGFDEKTHIQIAVRNPDCIKGVFRVPDAHLRHWAPDQAGSNGGI